MLWTLPAVLVGADTVLVSGSTGRRRPWGGSGLELCGAVTVLVGMLERAR